MYRRGLFTGRLQACGRIFIAKLKECQAGLVALLRDLVVRQQMLDNSRRILSDSFRPGCEALRSPFHILLLVFGHVAADGAVLIGTPMQPGMRADPAACIKYLDRALCHPDIYFCRIYSYGTE